MPLTIKSNQVKYKDPSTGNYVSMDTMSEKTAAEYQAAIQNTGLAQMNNINTRATEVQASLPTSGEMEAMVAAPFSASTAYTKGQYVIQTVNSTNKLYCFTTDHPAGAWTGTDVREIKLANDVSEIKSALDQYGIYPYATRNGYLKDDGTYAEIANFYSAYIEIKVTQGDVLLVKARGNGSARGVVFLNASNVAIEDHKTFDNTYTKITAPSGAVKAIVSSFWNPTVSGSDTIVFEVYINGTFLGNAKDIIDRYDKEHTVLTDKAKENAKGIESANAVIGNDHFDNNVVDVTYNEKWTKFKNNGTGWAFAVAQTAYIEFFNIGVEFLLLGRNEEYGIFLTLSSTGWGKLIALKEGTNDNNRYSTNLLSDDSYKAGQLIRVYNHQDGTFTVYINDNDYDIDLTEEVITLSGSRPIKEYCLGFGIHESYSTRTIYKPQPVNKLTVQEQMELKGMNYVPTFTSSDIVSKHATATISGNTVTVTPENVSNWEAVGIKPFRPVTLIGTEFAVIGLGTDDTYDYAITICLNSGNCGKLFIFFDGGGVFANLGTKVVNGNYNADRRITLTQISSHEIKVDYSGETTIIDLVDYCQFTLNGAVRNVRWDTISFGNCLFGARSFTFDNIANNTASAWDGKRWFAFGDSITYMGYYINKVNTELGTISSAFGHGGYSYAQLANVYTEMITGTTPDLITLFAGTNDFGHSGTIADMITGMETIIEGLYTAYPKVQLVIITPLQRNFDASSTPTETSGLGPNALGKYLIDYVKAIRDEAEKYSIPCLDFYSCGGINLLNATAKTSDGLHPTSAYGAVMGHIIAQFINNYMPFN